MVEALTEEGSETVAELDAGGRGSNGLQGGIERLESGFQLGDGVLLTGGGIDVVLGLLHGQRRRFTARVSTCWKELEYVLVPLNAGLALYEAEEMELALEPID